MIILDTNVVSELMRPAPAPNVVSWVRSKASRELYTTAVTVAEIRYGIERLANGRRKTLADTAAEELFATFSGTVLPFDAAAAVQYATVVTGRERAGEPINGFDAQIAAICRTQQAVLATRNIKDFRDTGVETIDPWAPSDAPSG